MRIDTEYMLLVLLLPIIPAFLLFRFLPASADVSGPFQGLKIKLGGAFAGYFITALFAWQVAQGLLKPKWSDNWTVVAHVTFDPTSGEHPSANLARVWIEPPNAVPEPTGSLSVKEVPIKLVADGDNIPYLIVALDGYQMVSVPLDSEGKVNAAYGAPDYRVTFDEKTHEILIGNPIVMTKGQ